MGKKKKSRRRGGAKKPPKSSLIYIRDADTGARLSVDRRLIFRCATMKKVVDSAGVPTSIEPITLGNFNARSLNLLTTVLSCFDDDDNFGGVWCYKRRTAQHDCFAQRRARREGALGS